MRHSLLSGLLMLSFVGTFAAAVATASEAREPASKHRSKKRRRKIQKIIRNDFSSRQKPRRGLASTEDQPRTPPPAPPANDQTTYEPDAYSGRSTGN